MYPFAGSSLCKDWALRTMWMTDHSQNWEDNICPPNFQLGDNSFFCIHQLIVLDTFWDDKSRWWGRQKLLCPFCGFEGWPSKWSAGESIRDQSREVAMHYSTSPASPWQPSLFFTFHPNVSALIDRINLWGGEQLIDKIYPTFAAQCQPRNMCATHARADLRNTHWNIWEIQVVKYLRNMQWIMFLRNAHWNVFRICSSQLIAYNRYFELILL